MAQNRSSAVMQQRSEPHDSLDDFPTPPWATRALLEWLQQLHGFNLSQHDCREPCANRGYMVKPLSEYFGAVIASDVFAYEPVFEFAAPFDIIDFLFGPAEHFSMTDFSVLNPPFRLAEQFIERALSRSRHGIAVILRSAFLESIGRFERLFGERPPTDILQFVERVPMTKGVVDPEASSATAYAWLVWLKRDMAKQPYARLHWIAPCREKLERADDYPGFEVVVMPPDEGWNLGTLFATNAE